MVKKISKEKSFKRTIETPLGSRVHLPFFDSKIHELTDKEMNQKWVLLSQRCIYECFFDENWEPWDDKLTPEGTDVINFGEVNSSLSCEVSLQDGTILTYSIRG